MKSGQFEKGGEPIPEVVVIFEKGEAQIVYEALKAYSAANPRRRTVGKLLEEFAASAVFL